MTGRRDRKPTLLPLWRKARRVSSAASRLPRFTSLRFALHGWQRLTLLSGVTLEGDNTPGAVVRYKTESDYDMVRESLKIAIAGQGLLISGALHVQ